MPKLKKQPLYTIHTRWNYPWWDRWYKVHGAVIVAWAAFGVMGWAL